MGFLDFVIFRILEFGCWIKFCKSLINLSNPQRKKRKTKDREKQKHKKEQVHCLQGVNPVLPQEGGPLHGTLANYLFCVLGRDRTSNERHRENKNKMNRFKQTKKNRTKE